MKYLINRKFWNKVIKKASKPYPDYALRIKGLLKKNPDYPELIPEFVLDVPEEWFTTKIIGYAFCWRFMYDGYMYKHLKKSIKTNGEGYWFYDLEKLILKVLIETKVLPPDVQYLVNGKLEYIVEQDQKKVTSSGVELVEKGFVYLIRNDDIYKIGITDNLLRRFNQLKPDEILNVVRCSNYQSLEKELHKNFKDCRIPQTEYFRLDKNQIEQVNIEMTKGANF